MSRRLFTIIALCAALVLQQRDDVVSAFTVVVVSSSRTTRSLLPLGAVNDDQQSGRAVAGSTDSYDEWYADFDPSDYASSGSSSSRSSDLSGGGGARRGGGGSSNGRGRQQQSHDYERDTSADQSNVNVDAVNALLTERLRCRKTGRFEEADEIRDELLLQHGVMVRDKDKLWRTGGSANGSGNGWLKNSNSGAGRDRNNSRGGRDNNRSGGGRDNNRGGGDRFNNNRRNDNSYDRRNNNSYDNSKKRSFGPNGHDYNLCRSAGPIISPLSEAEIHRLLAQRLECKLNRDFETADDVQQELMEAGVLINDGAKEWRADGKPFEAGKGSRAYEQSPNSLETSSREGDVETIQSMVNERSQAKSDRFFKRADALRQELLDDFNVVIDDKLQQWSIGGDFGRKSKDFEPFTRAPTSYGDDDNVDVDEVQRLVELRDAARADRNFQAADDIREDLLELHNVYLDDRQRQWAVGQQPSKMNNNINNGKKNSREFQYEKRGSNDSLSEQDEQTIMALLKERFEHKQKRNFQSADRIRDQLSDQYQVRIDDRSQEWHVVTNVYTMSTGSAPITDDETRSYIESQISKRALAKLAKDYDVADAIRDELMDKYCVSIDDRVKEYTKLEQADYDDGDDYTTGRFEDDEDEALQVKNDADDIELEEQDTAAVADLNDLTIPELKERLRAANLPVSGKKSELIERLTT